MFGAESQRSRRFGLLRGALLAAAPIPGAVATEVHGGVSALSSGDIALATALTALALIASWLVVERPLVGRVLATIALVGVLGQAFQTWIADPLTALAASVVATGGVAFLWSSGFATPAGRLVGLLLRARGAALVSLGFWLVATLVASEDSPRFLLLAQSASVGVSLGHLAHWSLRAVGQWPRFATATLLVSLVALLGLIAGLGDSWPLVTFALLVVVVLSRLAPTYEERHARSDDVWEFLTEHPERLLVGTFAVLAVVGCLVLALPVSSSSADGIDLIDAFFTSVSAVCVTGLVVLDTPVDFSPFGQVALLVLIQLGGLGIMTFSTAILDLLGRRLSLRHEGAMAQLLGARNRGSLGWATRRVLLTTFAFEGVGTLFLSINFIACGDAPATALWRGLFTSVSAFCNAGFALQSDSLIAYQSSAWVLHGVAVLIVAGGLSPPAILALPALFRGRHHAVTAQVKLGLVTTAILLGAGFVLFLAFEWANTLGGLSIGDRVTNAWFQSVTLRTAGFNSVELGGLRPATLLLMALLMFIGGNPGGTAGGVKTTTLAIIVISVIKSVRGSSAIDVFGRQLGHATRHKAALVVSLGVASFVIATFAILLTQPLSLQEAVFEVVSALGTVGLSIGGTARLDEIGKVVIALTMFAGRVGSLSLLLFLGQRSLPFHSERPEEVIDVG